MRTGVTICTLLCSSFLLWQTLPARLRLLGDPPLFLGFLRGVEFFWTTEHLIVPMATAVGLLLLIYFIADTILFNKEKEEFLEKESHYPKEPFGIDGKINFFAARRLS